MSAPYTEEWLPGPSKTQFYTRTYGVPSSGRPKAVIVFIHGLATHIGRFTELYLPIIQRGIAFFAFDQRGYGLTAQDPEKRSEGSMYGKTTWKDQRRDIAWAIEHVKKVFADTPLFLMGYSVGGTAALSFAAQNVRSPHKNVVSSLHGVIAICPLIQQTTPVSRLQRWIGSKVSLLIPYIPIALPVKAEELSHNEAFNNAWLKDPLVKSFCSLKSLIDMLRHGEALLKTSYKNWPESLPLLIAHGTADKIASCKASQEFFNKVPASNKKISLFEDCLHALMIENGEKLGDEVAQIIETHQSLPQRQLFEKSDKATLADHTATYDKSTSHGTYGRRRKTF